MQNLCRDKEVFCCDNKSYRVIEFYRDRRKFDHHRKRTEISQVKSVVTKISMSQQITYTVIKTREEKFVETKENYVVTEIVE